ncbi:MAG: glycosyltransferase family 2 protein [Enterocloster clostridioformis]
MQAEHSNFGGHLEGGFNYSAINNYGVSFAKGEYLLLLNNDTELIDGDSIKEMLGFCQREDGHCGSQCFRGGDDTIQHAGVVIGFGGIAGHTFIGLHKVLRTAYFTGQARPGP